MSEEVVEEIKLNVEPDKELPKSEFKLRSIVDILADLKKPIPKERLKTKQQAGVTITYLPWFRCVKLLNHYAPAWEYRITGNDVIVSEGQKIEHTIRVELTIHAIEGIFTRAATATAVQDWDSSYIEKKKDKKSGAWHETGKTGRWTPVYGGLGEISEGAALRRAASKFGVALELYEGD
jgi:hypothetical protein